MRFQNGCWMMQAGFEAFTPAEAYFIQCTETQVRITAPTHPIVHRGATLGGVNLTIEVSSPAPEVLRIRTCHYAGALNQGPEFHLLQGTVPLKTEETADTLVVSSGSLSLVIDKKHMEMKFERNGEYLTGAKRGGLSYIRENWKGMAYVDDPGQHSYMCGSLSLGVGEHVYGTGERFTAFVKNGQALDIWNEDGGTSTSQSYKNIPFYLTDKGYGVLINESEKVSLEIASDSVKQVQFSVPGESLDYFIFNGPAMKEVLMRYTDLTGKPALPPVWSFGLWLSTSFTTNYDEQTVMSFIDGMSERGIPLKVFHFDCFWMREFCWSDFIWNPEMFPDPAGMLARIKAKGLKVCVWINSYIGQESALFEEGMKNGYFIKRKDGSVWQWDMWQPGMAIVDFTNPEACAWYQSKLEALLDMGVDCFKTDFGERIPTECVYADGSDPQKMHNYYTYLYNKCVFDLLLRKRGEKEAVLFARSATVGGQQFPVHWGGDCWSDYESMAESLRGGLSLTMSGFGYWSHDIGGFEDTSTADVYKRWCAFGLLSSHSRLHGSSSYRVPWNYDEESVEVLRFFTKLKLSLMPYLYTQAVANHYTGVPVMRAMVLEYENDPACTYLDQQYMLGDSLLVSPVFNPEGMANYYLPEGIWYDYLTCEKKNGGKWYREKHGYCSIPLLVREGSIIACNDTIQDTEENWMEGLAFRIFGLQEGVISNTVVYAPGCAEEPACTISALQRDGEVVINTNVPCRVCLIEQQIQADVEAGETIIILS